MDTRRLSLLLLAGALLASPAAADSPQQVGDCATVTASVRLQAYGYAHVVTLNNTCQRAVTCEVWTDVDPQPHQSVQAKPGQSAEVITRNGSPSREVRADKLCHFTL